MEPGTLREMQRLLGEDANDSVMAKKVLKILKKLDGGEIPVAGLATRTRYSVRDLQDVLDRLVQANKVKADGDYYVLA